MPDNVILYGDYIESKCPAEHSILHFEASTLNIDELWENGFQSASFLSKFWGNFFSAHDEEVKADIENSVRYIAAELIGNAVKYGYRPDLAIKIVLSVPDSEIHIFVKNKVGSINALEYQNLIRQLLSSDPEKMFIDQMEQIAIDSNTKSCIGFLTILLDYGGNLGWKFEVEDNSETMTTTTTVRLPVLDNLQSSPTIV